MNRYMNLVRHYTMPTLPPSKRAKWLPERKAHERRKVSNKKVYNSPDWKDAARHYLHSNPYCTICKAQGWKEMATVVDHIHPINQGGSVWDRDNWQALCDVHHNQKSGREAHHKDNKDHHKGWGV